MAAGSTGILKYFRPIRSSSPSTTPTLPDPDGPLSERVPAKAIQLANAKVKQSKESSRGRRASRGCCSLHYKGKLGLVISIFTPRFVLIRQSFTVGLPLGSGSLNFCLILQVGDLPKFFSPMQYFVDLPKFYAANVPCYTVLRVKSIVLLIFCDFWNASNSPYLLLLVLKGHSQIKTVYIWINCLKCTCPTVQPFKSSIF